MSKQYNFPLKQSQVLKNFFFLPKIKSIDHPGQGIDASLNAALPS